jgi:hypothetical protein
MVESHDNERFELDVASITFVNYPKDIRGEISNAILSFKTFGGVQVDFQISSDTGTYRRMLEFFRKNYPKRMEKIFDAAPTRTRFP